MPCCVAWVVADVRGHSRLFRRTRRRRGRSAANERVALQRLANVRSIALDGAAHRHFDSALLRSGAKDSSWGNQRNNEGLGCVVLSVPGYTASDVRSAKPDNHMWNFALVAHPGLHFFDVLAATETLQAGYAEVSSSHTAAAFSVTAGFAEQMCREPCDADCCCGDVIDSWRHDFDLNESVPSLAVKLPQALALCVVRRTVSSIALPLFVRRGGGGDSAVAPERLLLPGLDMSARARSAALAAEPDPLAGLDVMDPARFRNLADQIMVWAARLPQELRGDPALSHGVRWLGRVAAVLSGEGLRSTVDSRLSPTGYRFRAGALFESGAQFIVSVLCLTLFLPAR